MKSLGAGPLHGGTESGLTRCEHHARGSSLARNPSGIQAAESIRLKDPLCSFLTLPPPRAPPSICGRESLPSSPLENILPHIFLPFPTSPNIRVLRGPPAAHRKASRRRVLDKEYCPLLPTAPRASAPALYGDGSPRPTPPPSCIYRSILRLFLIFMGFSLVESLWFRP